MFNKLKDKMNTAGNEAMEKHLVTVQGLAKQHVGPKLKEIGNDEAKLVVSEDKFVQFCMDNRQRILDTKAA